MWRRRRCVGCGAVFSTQETPKYELTWRVRHDGRLEPFSRLRLFMSLHRSCNHRETALSDAEGLMETVIRKLAQDSQDGCIEKGDIVRTVQVALNRFDSAASVYYSARHKV